MLHYTFVQNRACARSIERPACNLQVIIRAARVFNLDIPDLLDLFANTRGGNDDVEIVGLAFGNVVGHAIRYDV
jgi:hypothetical protein